MKKLLSVIVCLFLGVTMMMAQTKTVQGVVLSGEDGEPIIGASVVVTGTTTGTVTDIDGNFSLKVADNAKTLTVSFVGMESVVANISNRKMEIVLNANNEVLDEVMVVAFGTAKKSAFTGSAKVVGEEQLALSQVSDVTSALAGAVAGVTLTSSNGGPGSSPTIRVRGFGSLNAGKDPLIIVDGAPYSGDMNNINPNDVESMTVLKDAASNALYGARGANGVIMITTKKAKQGRDAVVTFDAKFGGNTSALKQYNVLKDPRQYYELQYDAMKNYYMDPEKLGLSAAEAWQRANKNITTSNGGFGYNIWTVPEGEMLIGANGKVNPNATLGRLVNYKGTDYWIQPDDWYNVGTRTGARQEYNVSISGAHDKGSFLLSLGYLDNQGITENSSFDRITARLRADYQAKKWLNVGATFNYAKFTHHSLSNNGSSSSTGNIWAFTSQMAPIYPIYFRDADKNIMVDGNGIQMMDYGNGKNAGFGRPFISDANPIQDVKLNTNADEGNALGVNAFADFTFYKGLVLSIKASGDLDETRSTIVYNPYYGQFDSTGGTVEKNHSRSFDYNLQQLLNYTTTIKEKHNLNVMVGHEYYRAEGYGLGASKSKMFSQSNKELSGAVVDGQSAYSSKSVYNNEGYFGRVQYDYDEKIFGSASFRRDASSRFHPDHRWGSFWSVGGAWILTKEDWLSDVKWLDNLKFKASYGQQGNDNIGSYRYVDVFDIVNASGNIGTSFATKGTEDITWETQGNFNAGFEFGFLNRISGSIEYFRRNTTDMLFSFSVAPSLGYSSYYDNVGDMYNSGIELDLNVNAYRSKDISWDIYANISTLRNRISMLHEDKKNTALWDANGTKVKGYTSGSFFICEDVSIYSWRLKEFAGVDPETGKSLWYKNTFQKDANGEFVLDAEGDKIWTGRETTDAYSDADYYLNRESTLPKLQGGFGTTFRAYGFDLSVNFTYQIGGKTLDYTYQQFMSNPTSSNTGYNWHVDVLNAWTPENRETDVPRWNLDDTYAAATSTRFLTDASYLNIQNINFGYTLPARLTKKAQINSVRLYLSCENVGYISKRQGFDPRQSYSGGSDATNYSPMRTISGGLSLQF